MPDLYLFVYFRLNHSFSKTLKMQKGLYEVQFNSKESLRYRTFCMSMFNFHTPLNNSNCVHEYIWQIHKSMLVRCVVAWQVRNHRDKLQFNRILNGLAWIGGLELCSLKRDRSAATLPSKLFCSASSASLCCPEAHCGNKSWKWLPFKRYWVALPWSGGRVWKPLWRLAEATWCCKAQN